MPVIITPQLNQHSEPVQFDGTVTVAGLSLSSRMTASGPAQLGFTGATCPVYAASSTLSTGTTGAVYLCAMYLPANTTLSSMYFNVTTAGTNTHNLLGIYSTAGALLASCTDLGVISTTGLKQGTLTSQLVIPSSGMYWAAYCSVASVTTVVSGSGMPATLLAGSGVTAANLPFAINGTATTALATTITPSSNTATNALPIWIGVS